MFLKNTCKLLALLLSLVFFVNEVFAADTKSDAVAAAVKESNLYIYGSVDKKVAQLLTKEFEGLYPGIKVDFIDMTPAEVFSRHMRDLSGRRVSADVLWNSDIALQAALVKDGYVLPYRPAGGGSVMPLAYIGDTAFVTGFEPVVIAYNRKLVAAEELPVTRKLLVQAAGKAAWRGRIATCDPEKSQLAYLLLTQDLAYGENFWRMVAKLGDGGLKLYPDYPTLLAKISGGEVLAGYNLPLSEVLKRTAIDENVGWLFTGDYTLAIPQSAVITKTTTHPQAARLWIDFLHSAGAQQLIAESADLFPVDAAVVGGAMKKLGGKLPPAPALRVIGTGAEVTRFSEKGMKKGFLLRWKQKLKLVP